MLSISKIISKISIAFAVIITAVNFYSCGDDTVIVVEDDFDLPRYNWKSMEIPANGFAGIWAKDTGNIFLLNHYNKSLYKITDGNTNTYYIGEYYLNEIKGISNTEIYIFGTNLVDQKLTIIKWNGAGFEYYPSNISVEPWQMVNIKGLAKNINEIWAFSLNGIVKFDGTAFNSYHVFDPNALITSVFADEMGNIQYISNRAFENGAVQQQLFVFNDTGFVQKFNFTQNGYGKIIYLEQVNGMKFGFEYDVRSPTLCYRNFDDSMFTVGFCFDKRIITKWIGRVNIDGQSLNDFIFIAETTQDIFEKKVGLIHWNGNKVSAEISLEASDLPDPFYKFIVYNADENFNLLLCPYSASTYNCTLYIGGKKND